MPELRERGRDRRLEVALGELAHRQVHGDPERARIGAQRVPARGLRAGGVEHEAPDRLDQAGLLGDGDEVGGGSSPRVGCSQRRSASTETIEESRSETIG